MPAPFVALRAARRLAPLAIGAYRRWQRLTPEEKERYKQRARDYAQRGRSAVERAQSARRGRRK